MHKVQAMKRSRPPLWIPRVMLCLGLWHIVDRVSMYAIRDFPSSHILHFLSTEQWFMGSNEPIVQMSPVPHWLQAPKCDSKGWRPLNLWGISEQTRSKSRNGTYRDKPSCLVVRSPSSRKAVCAAWRHPFVHSYRYLGSIWPCSDGVKVNLI